MSECLIPNINYDNLGEEMKSINDFVNLYSDGNADAIREGLGNEFFFWLFGVFCRQQHMLYEFAEQQGIEVGSYLDIEAAFMIDEFVQAVEEFSLNGSANIQCR